MRIHTVHIDNFRAIDKFTLNLCDSSEVPRPLTIVVGPNMSGKTTVLDALHLAHAAIENAAAPRMRPDFDPNDPLIRTDPNLPIRVHVVFSLHSGEWDEIDRLERALGNPGALFANSAMYSVKFRWPPSDGSQLGIEAAVPKNANQAFRGRATAKVARSRRLVEEIVFDQVGGMLYLDQHRSVNLRAPSTTTAPEEQLRDQAGSRDVLPWLEFVSRLDQKWDAQKQGESTWNRVKRLFAALATPARIDDVKASDEGFDLRLKSGDGHYYYSAGMSSGERQLLRLVANLASQRARRSVILIDELELHLHPEWQRNLVHFCRQGGDDDNQFIVTTHSESILRYVDPDCVIRLGELGGQ